MSLHQFAETHEVFNQVPSLDGANLYRLDLPLQEWSRRFGAGWAEQRLDTYGALAGGPLMAEGFLANEHKPQFKTHDRYGNRIDLVEFHPAYHELMRTAIEHGLPSLPWTDPRAGANVVRAGLTYLHSQAEAASGCPLTMTFAAVPALKLQPDIAEQWLPKILATEYDPRNVGIEQKAGVTIGMAMTEKQGGTDVRANTTRAYPVGAGGPGQAYELVGHKWFCSAPMCDAFLTLAQTDKGLSCFLLPRHRPDGTRNQFYVQRLKNKLGNWANASSEVEYRGALAWMIGEEGRGVPTIIEMVAMTRFDCMVGSSSLMRQALTQAAHHCAHRKVGGKLLADQPTQRHHDGRAGAAERLEEARRDQLRQGFGEQRADAGHDHQAEAREQHRPAAELVGQRPHDQLRQRDADHVERHGHLRDGNVAAEIGRQHRQRRHQHIERDRRDARHHDEHQQHDLRGRDVVVFDVVLRRAARLAHHAVHSGPFPHCGTTVAWPFARNTGVSAYAHAFRVTPRRCFVPRNKHTVVPAKAGTHNHRRALLKRAVAPASCNGR